MTDEAKHYYDVACDFAGHGTVKHSEDEYVRHEVWIDSANRIHIEPIHTNTVEGYYSIFKRGMKGVYQHCAEKHLHRYLAEFDFRHSNRVRLGVDDVERTEHCLRGIVGKRLTYRTTHI
jgi:ISXO2-like transposase domain